VPRQIDLFPQNLQVNNDPTNRMGVTAAQINHLQDQIPAAQAAAQQVAINAMLTALDKVTGLDLVGWWKDTQDLLNFINAAQQQSWLNFQQFLNGLVQDIDVDVAGAISYLNGIGQAANDAWTQVQDFLLTGDWSDLSTAWQDIFQAIFGSSTSLGLVGSIPAPAVVDVVQNLQPVFDFPDTQSVSAGSQWSWDGTHDHTGVAGSGSAKVVANGVLQALRGTPGAVQPGQTVTGSAYVMWSGLVSSGSPIQLELIPYSRTGSTLFAGSPVTVASIASPASSGSWTHLTGTYTVPSSGVDAVQLRLVVTGSATAGSVWWDDCHADVSGGFLADMQADTNNIIDSFAPGGTSGEFVTGVQNLLSLVGLSPTSIGTATDLTALWTAIVNDFINPLNALEISAINGLTSTLNALLPTTTYQFLVDGIANALGHSGTGHTWTDVETYLGIIPPTNVGNVLGGSNLGADVSSVHTTAVNGTSWSTRLTNDLLTLLDVFHVTYTVTQWNAAWNDLLALFGIVNSTTTPTDPSPTIGPSITAAQSSATTAGTNASTAIASASTAQTTANTGNTNTGTFLGYTRILSDVFHLTYQAGTSSDSPTTLGTNGLPTWYSAWNGLLQLEGLVKSTTAPTDTAPTTGTVIQANTATANTASTNASIAIANASAVATTAQQITDGIFQSQNGGTSTGNATSTIVPSLTNIPASNIVGSTGASVTYGATGAGSGLVSGTTNTSATWTHTILSTDLGVLVGISYYYASGQAPTAVSVSYGSQAMTRLYAQTSSSLSGNVLATEVWWLKSPLTGTKTVTATVTNPSCLLAGNSVSYFASKTVTAVGNTGGNAANPSMSTSSASGRMVFGVFAVMATAAPTLTAFSQTQRSNQGPTSGWAMAMGDAAGAASVAFSVHSAAATNVWCGITIELSN
jgi:hypothetical protein